MTTLWHDQDLDDRRSRERRIARAGLLASLALHVLIVFLSPVAELVLGSAAGPNRNDVRAASGISQVVALASAPPEAAFSIPLPQPVVAPTVPEVFIPEPVPDVVEVPLPPVEEVGVGSTTGTDAQDTGSAGLPDQDGGGAGGDRVEGPARTIPPSPRGMIMPPANRDLRGQEVSVWVFVNEAGRVVADSTRLEPPTSDRRFNEQIVRDAAQWVFTPARENGAPVAAWFPYLIGF